MAGDGTPKFYGRAQSLDGPRATITAEQRETYWRDVQVLINRQDALAIEIKAAMENAGFPVTLMAARSVAARVIAAGWKRESEEKP